MNLPDTARALAQLGIAGQATAAQHHDLLAAQRPGRQFGALMLNPPVRRIAHPGHPRGA